MVCLDPKCLACRYGGDVWISVAIASDPTPPPKFWHLVRRTRTTLPFTRVKLPQCLINPAEESGGETEDRAVKVDHRGSNLIEWGDEARSNAAGAPKISELLSKSAHTECGFCRISRSRASVQQDAHSAKEGNERASTRLSRVCSKHGVERESCHLRANTLWGCTGGERLAYRVTK